MFMEDFCFFFSLSGIFREKLIRTRVLGICEPLPGLNPDPGNGNVISIVPFNFFGNYCLGTRLKTRNFWGQAWHLSWKSFHKSCLPVNGLYIWNIERWFRKRVFLLLLLLWSLLHRTDRKKIFINEYTLVKIFQNRNIEISFRIKLFYNNNIVIFQKSSRRSIDPSLITYTSHFIPDR